jgi:hypothetical protein
MTISMLDDMWGTFNVREDQLNGMQVGTEFTAFVPAFNKDIKMKVYYMKDQGSYAVWKATKANGQYDLKTFELKARPTEKVEGLRPGMSLVVKQCITNANRTGNSKEKAIANANRTGNSKEKAIANERRTANSE